MESILADASISITELKRNPSAVIEAADGKKEHRIKVKLERL